MQRIEAVIVGGGQAGLAMSRSLAERGVEHVVLERGRVGERWRSQRWDSLRLLTPRWLSRLTDWDHMEGDPRGFMDRQELIRYLDRYAEHFRVPLRTGVTVSSLERDGVGFRIETNHGSLSAESVVIATGESQQAFVPAMSRDLPGWVRQAVPTRYRNPEDLPDGGVLVVGASATGIQLAEEIHTSGRPVTLSVGRHTRLPRRYRDRDILEWFQRLGILEQPLDQVKNPEASRNQPSMQLIGSPDHRTLDLGVLQSEGVRLVGWTQGSSGSRVYFGDDLVENLAAADMKLAGLRLRIDKHILEMGLRQQVGPEEPFIPMQLPGAPQSLDLRGSGIRSVLWATGFKRSYPWLRVPVLGSNGEIRHYRGITPAAGLYVLGLNFMRRRSSSFLAGVGTDAEELAEHLVRNRTRPGARRSRAVA